MLAGFCDPVGCRCPAEWTKCTHNVGEALTFGPRGHFLINYPDLPKALFEAFTASKEIYINRLRTDDIENPTAIDEMHKRILERDADPLPYGIAPNRALLVMYLEQCLSQGVLTRPVTLEELFEPSTLELIG